MKSGGALNSGRVVDACPPERRGAMASRAAIGRGGQVAGDEGDVT